MMFDHISIGVADLSRSSAFYDAVFAPLGYARLWSNARGVGYGPVGFRGEEEPFAILAVGAEARAPGQGCHIAIVAATRDAVDRFHAAALLVGGVDEGAPGIREKYGPGYYAAFVRDPDGYRVEAVVHETEHS